MKLDIGKIAGPVDGNKEMKLAFRRPHFGNVYMEVANRIGLELLLWSFVALNFRQPFNAMALKATMQ